MSDRGGARIEGQCDTKRFRHVKLEGVPCICLVSEDAQALQYGDIGWQWMNLHQSLGTEFDDVLQLGRVFDRLIDGSASLLSDRSEH